MNFAFLPDLFALAILIVILGLVRRQHSEARADAWLLGLFFTLIEALAHTFYARQGMPIGALHVTVMDCYALAGLVFTWAAGDQRLPRNTRLLYLVLNSLPLLALTTIYGLNVRLEAVYFPTAVAGLIVGVTTSIMLRHNWRYALLYLLGWSEIGALIHWGLYRQAAYWSLGCLYAMAAINFERRLERQSTGKVAIVLGFSIWALCFLLHPWVIEHHPSYAEIVSHVWNMQKALISIGMILVMLEEQVSNNQWLALHDELTGLPNRRLFAGKLTSALEHADRTKSNVVLVVLDLNGFKNINDSLGHPAGDEVLREVSSVLRKSIRASDTVARLGGDEFILLAKDMTNLDSVERFVDSLRFAIERPILLHGQPMQVGASFGFAMYPEDAQDAVQLLRLADQRMYFIKKRPIRSAQIETEVAALSAGMATFDVTDA